MKWHFSLMAVFLLLSLLVPPAAAEFSDVPGNYWAWAEIEGCVDAGIVSGYGDGTYRPANTVTRDQMAVYVARALAGGDPGVPEGPATPSFLDVPNTGYGDGGTDPYWAYKYVEYAFYQNVVQGYQYDDPDHPGETLSYYEPLWTVTRDQMAVYVARALVAPSGEAALEDYVPADPRDFPDVPASGYGDGGTDPYWAYKHVEYCVENGVVQGYEYPDPDHPGESIFLYEPTWPVTRDQMAVYVARAFELEIPIQTFDVTDYFDLTQGNRWDYMTSEGPDRIQASGTASIGGQTYVRLSDPQGRTNFFRSAPEGVYWAGIDSSGDQYRFTPPLLLPNGLAIGQEANQAIDLYLNGANQGPGTFRLVLVRRENLSLPAGSFPGCLVLEWDTSFPAGLSDHLYLWVAPGIGIVQQDASPVAGSYWEQLYSASIGGVRYPQTYDLGYYFPLAEGDTWNYGPPGTYTQTISGTATLRGRTFICKVNFAENEISYYQSAPEGFYFGGDYYDDETMAIEPPFLYPSGMALGETRNATGSMYLDDVLQGAMSASLTLLGEDDVTVPAGFFPSCVKIELHVALPNDSEVHQFEWYAAGVGLVMRDDTAFGGDDYQELFSGTIGGITYP